MTTEPPPVPEASALAAKYASQIANKTVMITGVSPASIGSNLAVDLSAASPALVILTGRSAEKLSQTSKAITDAHPGVPVRTVLVDLGSIASVRKGAEEVLSWDDVPAIDVLVNNAGIMGVDYSLSEDGIEMQFAANHIGHFLLANLIMPKLLKSGEPRVVSVTSDGHRLSFMRWDDVNFDVSLPVFINHCRMIARSETRRSPNPGRYGRPSSQNKGGADTVLREAARTTDGWHTASPRQPTRSLLSPWPGSSAPRACKHTASTRVSS